MLTYLDYHNTIAVAINKKFGIETDECKQIMDTLYDRGFLIISGDLCSCMMTPSGVYAKRTTPDGDKYLTLVDLN